MIVNPKTTLEMFQNIKLAFSGTAMLDDSFYTDENLKSLAGGQSILRDDVPIGTELYVEGFGNMVADLVVGNYPTPGISFFVRRGPSVLLNNAFTSSITVEFIVDDPNLSYANLETLFGKDWQPTPPQLIHVDDNQLTIMNYQFEDSGVNHISRFVFNPRGYLQRASFTVYNSKSAE